MSKKWNYDQVDAEEFAELKQQLGIANPFITTLLKRGIKDFEQAKSFFRPSIEALSDPFLLKGMPAGVERLEEALQKNEKILIYGDYDVDGTTSISIIYTFFSKLTQNIHFYTPDRYKEGYGLSVKSLANIKDCGYDLMLTLDCGTSNIDEVQLAKTLQIDTIIIDHHIPREELPAAVALINPKQADCPSSFKEFATCGLCFKFVQAFAEKNGIHFNNYKALLELVAIGTLADLVPLTEENRVLTHLGLQLLNRSPSVSVSAINKVVEHNKTYKATDVSFKIGPLINAAGRMKHASEAVALLTATSQKKAEELAGKLYDCNTLRRTLEKEATQQALDMLAEASETPTALCSVLYDPNWHAGVIGIVASRLIEQYYRPTIVLCKSGDLIVGSARSVADFNIYEAINECQDLLEQYGGHKYAAGLKLREDNLTKFKEKFELIAKSAFQEAPMPRIQIDAVISLEAISRNFINLLSEFEPTGKGNPRPLFATKNLKICSPVLVMKNMHLKFQVESSGVVMDCIAFNFHHMHEILLKADKIAICYYVDMNEWNSRNHIQLIIKDFKISSTVNNLSESSAAIYNTRQ